MKEARAQTLPASRWRSSTVVARATVGGTLLAAAAMFWLTLALLTGPGATWRVLLPALLFLLPLLGFGAAVGYLAGRLLSLATGSRN